MLAVEWVLEFERGRGEFIYKLCTVLDFARSFSRSCAPRHAPYPTPQAISQPPHAHAPRHTERLLSLPSRLISFLSRILRIFRDF